MIDVNDTITYRQLSQLTGVSEGTLRVWVSKRLLPHLRLGPRTVRFKRTEIERWLAARVVNAG
jgi:excisionase family DNA binding protein